MWFADVCDKQTPLGVRDPNDRAGAEAALLALLKQLGWDIPGGVAPPPVSPAAVVPDGPTVAEACVSFLAWCDGKAAAGKIERKSAKNYREHLKPLTEELGGRPLRSVTAEEVERWADKPAWSASYQNNVLGTTGMAFKRAGHALRIHRPSKESRGADTCLTDDQFAAVVVALRRPKPGGDGDLVELLEALRETGARPGELAPLGVEGVDWPNTCAVLRKHKTRKKTGKDRVIHFNAAAMAVLERQRARYGTGLLFRNKVKRAYHPNQICDRLSAVSLVVGFRVIAYGLGRHSFATSALANGVPDALVAELLGQHGTGMLNRHYAHLGQRSRELKAAAEKATKRAG